jgi:hypothetical protein
MKEQQLNAAVDKFIRNVSLTARREIEKNVRAALKSGKLKGQSNLATAVTVSAEKIGLDVTIHSRIEL